MWEDFILSNSILTSFRWKIFRIYFENFGPVDQSILWRDVFPPYMTKFPHWKWRPINVLEILKFHRKNPYMILRTSFDTIIILMILCVSFCDTKIKFWDWRKKRGLFSCHRRLPSNWKFGPPGWLLGMRTLIFFTYMQISRNGLMLFEAFGTVMEIILRLNQVLKWWRSNILAFIQGKWLRP